MRLDDLLGDGQTQPRIVAELRRRAFRIEAVEDTRQRLAGYARPRILDHRQHPVGPAADPDAHGIPVLAKRNGIRDQVDEDLRQPAFQPVDHDGALRHVGHDFHAPVARLPFHVSAKGHQHGYQIERALVFLHQLAVQAGRVGYVTDQTVQPPHIVVDHVEQKMPLIVPPHHPQRPRSRAQRGERVLQFVGHIGRKAFIGIAAIVKRRDHPAQGTRKAPDLVEAVGHVGDRHPQQPIRLDRRVAPDLGGVGEIGQWLGDGRCQRQTQPDRHQKRHQHDAQDVAARGGDQAVDTRHVRRQDDDALPDPVHVNRGGSRQDVRGIGNGRSAGRTRAKCRDRTALGVMDECGDALAKRQPGKHVPDPCPVARRFGQAAGGDSGDQRRLGPQTGLALFDQCAAERIEHDDPRHKDEVRHKVDRDDLSRQRPAPQPDACPNAAERPDPEAATDRRDGGAGHGQPSLYR
ncbi:hypothetical protein OCGS_1587 [Oceaniovalibus guishaninsula JLT2003]|uniref:Uncharacterized protein n=1 Tax=Oceaniovalibus guishaninsula JLT2003 TaxID=1231392 RepID=K2GN25_9RHOB|nr:hypothetical protein OCGS_1587 [Oceaniovalibus guishaninsula JLT2003]